MLNLYELTENLNFSTLHIFMIKRFGIGELYTFTILAIVIVITMLLLYSITKNFTSYAGSQSSKILELASTQFTTSLGNATGLVISLEFSGNPPLPSNNGTAMCIITYAGTQTLIGCNYTRISADRINVKLAKIPVRGSLLDLRIPLGEGFVGSIKISYIPPSLDLLIIPGTTYVNPSGVFNETIMLGMVNNSTGWQYIVTDVNGTRIGTSLIPPGQVSYVYRTIALRAPSTLPATITLVINVTINGAYSIIMNKSFTLVPLPGSPMVPKTCQAGVVRFGYVSNGTNPPQLNSSTLLGGALRIYPGTVDGSLNPIFTTVNLNLITGLLNVLLPSFYTAYYNVNPMEIQIGNYPYVTVSIDPVDYPPEGSGFFLLVVSNENASLLGLPIGYKGIILYWPPPGKYTLGNFLNYILGDPVVLLTLNGDVIIARLHPLNLNVFPSAWNTVPPIDVSQYLDGKYTYRYVGFGMYFSSGLLNLLGGLIGNPTLPLNALMYPRFNLYWNYLCVGSSA